MTRGAALRVSLLAAELVVAGALTGTTQAQPAASARVWSSDTALTMPRRRTEFGLFHPIHWGVSDNVELSAHPVLASLMPYLEAKVGWFYRGPGAIASRHRIAYLTPLLDLLAKEGSLGLLPANTVVPQAIAVDTAYLATASLSPAFRLTFEVGALLIARGSGNRIVLDFPFLYSRFGALASDANIYAGLKGTGVLGGSFAWQADLRLTSVPAIARGFTLEGGASLQWFASHQFGLSVGARFVHGRYPVGLRVHWMPTIDILVSI